MGEAHGELEAVVTGRLEAASTRAGDEVEEEELLSVSASGSPPTESHLGAGSAATAGDKGGSPTGSGSSSEHGWALPFGAHAGETKRTCAVCLVGRVWG